MASPTQWTWIWVSSGSWWWTGKPGVLQSVESQRVGPTERLNWTELNLGSVLRALQIGVLTKQEVKLSISALRDFFLFLQQWTRVCLFKNLSAWWITWPLKTANQHSCLFKNFLFNWRIIALQCCVGFCHTSTWFSHRYVYVLSPLDLPSTSHPSRLSQSTKLSSLCYTTTSR